MAVRWRDEHLSRDELITHARLRDGETGATAQDVGHQAAVTRIEMLDDHDRSGEGCGQALEQISKRADSAGGGSHGHDVEGRPQRPGRATAGLFGLMLNGIVQVSDHLFPLASHATPDSGGRSHPAN